MVGGTLGKLAMDVKLMMQTEVGEAYEPFAPGRGSSSTMPQKRNPISCCYIQAASPNSLDFKAWALSISICEAIDSLDGIPSADGESGLES